MDRRLPPGGEILSHQIFQALEGFLGGLEEEDRKKIVMEKKERPLGKGFCEGCPYTPLFEAIREVSGGLGFLIRHHRRSGLCRAAEPPPFEMLNLKYCMVPASHSLPA